MTSGRGSGAPFHSVAVSALLDDQVSTESRLNPALDVAGLAVHLADTGWMTISNLLDQGASRGIASQSATARRLEAGDQFRKQACRARRPTRQSLSAEKRAALEEAVYAHARRGSQFRYEAIRVPDGRAERETSDDPLVRFALWWPNVQPPRLSAEDNRQCPDRLRRDAAARKLHARPGRWPRGGAHGLFRRSKSSRPIVSSRCGREMASRLAGAPVIRARPGPR